MIEASSESSLSIVRRERYFRIAALLIVVGLVIELVSLRWAHPTAFLVFAGGTGLCVGLGVLLVLWTLFATGPTRRKEALEPEAASKEGRR